MPAPVIDSPDTRTKSVAALALLMVLPASIAIFMHRSVVVLRQPCLRLALGISLGIHPQ